MNDCAMNDILELWSQPWHALQRSLALSFGVESAAMAPGDPQPASARAAGTPADSWLVRALSVTAQASSSKASR
jgi:hypothetical protein